MLKRWVDRIEKYTDRPFYPALLGALAFVDLFLLVIPTDVFLVSYVALQPKRWWKAALGTALGSSLGAMVLAVFIQKHGVNLLESIAPGMMSSHWFWQVSDLMKNYGLLTLFGVSLSPFIQHPAVVLAALTPFPLISIFLVSFAARIIKYLVWAVLARQAPEKFRRIKFRQPLNPQ